jgi:hypothetical protein
MNAKLAQMIEPTGDCTVALYQGMALAVPQRPSRFPERASAPAKLCVSERKTAGAKSR